MRYRKLGGTGLEVSCVGFGALPLTGLNQEEANPVLNTALDLGMNFIDTARGYRESETLIGNAVSGRRGEYYLATKTKARREQEMRRELETSLRNLRTDHLDLYQIHYVNTEDDLSDVLGRGNELDVMRAFRDEGVCDFIGITGHDASVLLKAAKTGGFDTIQGAFSYIEKEKKIFDLIEYCERENIGFIDQKPLAGGAIVHAAAGLKWILGHPVSTVIPGMVTVEQVRENAAVGSGDIRISADEEEQLEALSRSLGNRFCRRCYYCHPYCPAGIRIGVILEFYGKAQAPENLALARHWYQGFKVNGSDCVECGLCVPQCPYGLPIPEMLKEAHELLG
jgi:predicted aldo/keto reductase-like oxidoreductase